MSGGPSKHIFFACWRQINCPTTSSLPECPMDSVPITYIPFPRHNFSVHIHTQIKRARTHTCSHACSQLPTIKNPDMLKSGTRNATEEFIAAALEASIASQSVNAAAAKSYKAYKVNIIFARTCACENTMCERICMGINIRHTEGSSRCFLHKPDALLLLLL